MDGHLEKREPVPLKVGTGSEMSISLAAIDSPDDSKKPLTRQALWRQRRPEAYAAHLAVAAAITAGKLVRPDRCDCCGKPGRVDAHHADYADKLNVRWLLRSCHIAEHVRQRRQEGGDE